LKVLILDGNQRSSLAAVRSLGKAGVTVEVGEIVSPSLASSSRYCSESFEYGNPNSAPDIFRMKIREKVKGSAGIIIFPMTDVTLGELLGNEEMREEDALIPLPDFEIYEKVTDKVFLLKTAGELEIPIPKTYFFQNSNNLPHILKDAGNSGFPLVVKPGRSRIRTKDGWIEGRVRYAESPGSLEDILAQDPFRSYPFLIQERVEGEGIGIFLLMREGEVLARFAHRRIREKPPSGGVSTLCESISPPEEAYQSAVKLLSHFGWTGVAMVEFKWDRKDKRMKLMEINGRFWGSLQLAIASGVDFPYYLYLMAMGEKVKGPESYRLGLKSRWELGDLDHLIMRMIKKEKVLNLPSEIPSKGKLATDFFLDFLRPSVKHEVMKLHDSGPFLFELKNYLRHIVRSDRAH